MLPQHVSLRYTPHLKDSTRTVTVVIFDRYEKSCLLLQHGFKLQLVITVFDSMNKLLLERKSWQQALSTSPRDENLTLVLSKNLDKHACLAH